MEVSRGILKQTRNRAREKKEYERTRKAMVDAFMEQHVLLMRNPAENSEMIDHIEMFVDALKTHDEEAVVEIEVHDDD